MMKLTNLMTVIICATLGQSAWGFGSGFSSYPMLENMHFVTTEASGVVSEGGGMGVHVRYTRKLNRKLIMDAGIGMSGGERTGRIFAGADYELYPDFARQPRVSLKAQIENTKEFDSRINILSIAPTVSKGYNFWGREAFPYFSMPVGLGLNSGSKTYQTRINANLGVVGEMPIRGYQHLTTSLEASLNVKNSFTGFLVGLSYPLN
jgi:hypothetical protein